MKITKIKSLGLKQTYNLGMKSKHHNYVTIAERGQPIHANSHAYAYGVIAYRSLWLKAHFPPEFWASILTFCHQDKRAKYVGVAKSEGVVFEPIRTGYLNGKLIVDDDLNVYPSLDMIKGIGPSVAESLSVDGGKCDNIDDFVERYGKKKGPIERLIKLGAFENVHKNRAKHIWFWYQFKYASRNDENVRIRQIYDEAYMEKHWPEDKLNKERARQIEEYKKRYPKKKKIPIKISNWKPKIGYKHDRPTRDEFIEFFNNLWAENRKVDKEDQYYYRDWSDKDFLRFEKEYLGVYWTSPLRLFKHNPTFKFSNIREDPDHQGSIHAVIEKFTKGTTKNGTPFVNLFVNDGVETQAIRIWGDSWDNQDQDIIKEGHGIRTKCDWSDRYQNFNLSRNAHILSLPMIEEPF